MMNCKLNFTTLLLTAAFLTVSPAALHAQAVPPPPSPPSALPQAVPTAPPVTLRFQFKPGMRRAYSVVMDVNGTLLTGQSGAGMPISQHMEMTLQQTVQSVRATDGAATIVTGIDAMKIGLADKQQTVPQSKLDLMKAMTTTVVTPLGKTESTILSPLLGKIFGSSMAGNSFNPTGLIETVFTLPAGPVIVGAAWHSSETAAAAAVAPTSSYVLKSLDISGGIPTAHIERTLDGNLNTMVTKSPVSMKIMSRTTGTGETEFDTQNGTVMSQETTGNAITTVVTTDPQTGVAQSYKMQLQTKVEIGQLFTAVVPSPAPVQ